MALKNRRSSATDINKSLSDAGTKVSNQTVHRRLVSAGLRARIPRKSLFWMLFSVRNAWSGQRSMPAGQQNSGSVLWSDETSISVFGSDRVRFTRRRSWLGILVFYPLAHVPHTYSLDFVDSERLLILIRLVGNVSISNSSRFSC